MDERDRSRQHRGPPDLACPGMAQQFMARGIAFDTYSKQAGLGISDRKVETECVSFVGRNGLISDLAHEGANRRGEAIFLHTATLVRVLMRS